LFILLSDNMDACDKLFKSFNIVVKVAFKLLIDTVDACHKLFESVFIPNTDKPDVVILPTTFMLMQYLKLLNQIYLMLKQMLKDY
jgi:hypothetical protein